MTHYVSLQVPNPIASRPSWTGGSAGSGDDVIPLRGRSSFTGVAVADRKMGEGAVAAASSF